MFNVIGDIFDTHELAALREAVAGLDYEDGKRTAGALARDVKMNAQASATKARDAVLKKVEAALAAHPVFASAARPKAFVRLVASRYEGGQAYGSHVDDALMAGGRTDLSFTLFLSDQDAYKGGALVIEDRIEDRAFKLKAGEVILYPSDTLHRVEPVTRGTRHAVVGWVTSWVREPARREVLFDLDEAIVAEREAGGAAAQIARLAKTRSNLIRMWAE
jgi:PKHD-type hydroxylase